jgi:hypothetical protein
MTNDKNKNSASSSTARRTVTTNTTENNNNNNNEDITVLRVAQSELVSGNTTGKVYMRLSHGSAPLLTSRPKVQTVVSSKLREQLLKQQNP